MYTNKKGLSTSWINAATAFDNDYDKCGWKSCTQLISPPIIALLRERHANEIVEDISDAIWKILGSATHVILEKSAEAEAITEQRIIIKVLGKEVSMKNDRCEKIPETDPIEYHLKDYKVVRVNAWKYGAKVEQIAQLNILRFGLATYGFNVTKLSLEMLLRDWNDLDAIKSPHDYPDAQVMPVQVPLWDIAQAELYLQERVQLFIDCETMSDNELPICTPKERWQRPDKFAVLKPKAAKAYRTFLSRPEADDFLAKMKTPGYHVEFRPGECVRCTRFCSVNKWCRFYQQINPAF